MRRPHWMMVVFFFLMWLYSCCLLVLNFIGYRPLDEPVAYLALLWASHLGMIAYSKGVAP